VEPQALRCCASEVDRVALSGPHRRPKGHEPLQTRVREAPATTSILSARIENSLGPGNIPSIHSLAASGKKKEKEKRGSTRVKGEWGGTMGEARGMESQRKGEGGVERNDDVRGEERRGIDDTKDRES
jgi:hypothetical protein